MPAWLTVRGQNVVSGPSSRSTFVIGLYTNSVPEAFPPHRMPSSVAFEPPANPKTSEPLSPGPTPAFTKVWHSCTMFVPDTPVFTHVALTVPWVHPVVRPTLLTTSPTTAVPSPVTAKVPLMVSDPSFGPLVWAMPPSVKLTPVAYAARAASLKRHRRPLGQPFRLRKYCGSSTSVPMKLFAWLATDWKYCVPSIPP